VFERRQDAVNIARQQNGSLRQIRNTKGWAISKFCQHAADLRDGSCGFHFPTSWAATDFYLIWCAAIKKRHQEVYANKPVKSIFGFKLFELNGISKFEEQLRVSLSAL
jgi:hypothetical protein